MFVIDAHLDLAYNALRGREVTKPANDQKSDGEDTPSVGIPDLRAGNVGLICGTIFCEPKDVPIIGYTTPEQAAAVARKQLDWYWDRHRAADLTIVQSRGDLPADLSDPVGPPRVIILLEGADALISPSDLTAWFESGLRAIGMAWGKTRYAGGTRAPGPLTEIGVELAREMDKLGVIHDASHLAEESFWQLMDLATGPVMASHSNCRAIVPTDRQLSDEMIKAIGKRDGVIGINYFDRFLLPPEEFGKRRATLADVVRHVRHMCDLIGDARHVGIGTDMDGGLGRESIPEEILTSADLPKTGDALSAAGLGDDDVRGILGGNWLEFFHRSLPR